MVRWVSLSGDPHGASCDSARPSAAGMTMVVARPATGCTAAGQGIVGQIAQVAHRDADPEGPVQMPGTEIISV